MGLTVTNKVNMNLGNKRGSVCDIAFDSSYPTGGETLQIYDAGALSAVDIVVIPTVDGYDFEYDYTNHTVIVSSGGTEVTDGTNLSSLTGVKVWMIGR